MLNVSFARSQKRKKFSKLTVFLKRSLLQIITSPCQKFRRKMPSDLDYTKQVDFRIRNGDKRR